MAFSDNIPKKNPGPNLLSAENEDCALNGDPMAHVHKDVMANRLQKLQGGGEQNHSGEIDNTRGKARFFQRAATA